METHASKSFFDQLQPKTAFILGFVTAILTIGTLGFVVLGTCVMNGGCEMAEAGTTTKTTTTTGGGAAAPVAAAPTAAVGKVPAVDSNDHIRGNEDAELTIVEYSDFQCPFCQRFHTTMQQVMEDYDGQVRWVYRHFPLSFHPEAAPSAEAAECAGEQGKFWEYADLLFANQSTLGTATYTKLAADLGLNASAFQTCLDSNKYVAVVNTDTQEGSAAGVTGTPGSFLIGKDGSAQAIKGALPFSSVQSMIDAALAE